MNPYRYFDKETQDKNYNNAMLKKIALLGIVVFIFYIATKKK